MSGVYAALITPRREACCEADAGRLLDYIERLEHSGVSGLVLFGSTGEFVHFDPEERMRLTGLAIKRSRVPLLVNISHSDFARVVALAENAVDAGASGLLILPPYFYRYDAATVEAFYSAIADLFSDQIALYLYNLPQHTSPITSDVACRLLASGRFAGIKDSSGDWTLFETLTALRREHQFRLLLGSERIYRRARELGADGTVSGVAAALPELITALETAIVAGISSRADRLEKAILEYLDWLEKFPATFLIRETAALRKWISIPPGLPLSAAQQADRDAFRHWFPAWHASVLETGTVPVSD